MEELKLITVPGIAALCYGVVELLKRAVGAESRIRNAYPLIAAVLGAGLGLLIHLLCPALSPVASPLEALLIGFASGLAATGGNQILKRMRNLIGKK